MKSKFTQNVRKQFAIWCARCRKPWKDERRMFWKRHRQMDKNSIKREL